MENREQGQIATCTSVGGYEIALTRGRQYEMFAQDENKRKVRVRGDNNRTRWYPAYLFDFTSNPVPVLTAWRFDDPVDDPLNGRDETNNLVDVVMTLSDGTKRWCTLATPEYLKGLLEPRSDPAQWGGAYEPAIWSKHLIVMRDLAEQTIDWTLRYMDQQGRLMECSCALAALAAVGNEVDMGDEEDE